MRIVQVTMVPLKPDGGLSVYVRQISRRLAEAGHRVTVIGQGRVGVEPRLEDRAYGLTWRVGLLDGGFATRVSPETVDALREAVSGADVAHLHGMRTKLNAVASRLANRAGVPVVISSHGQVHPWLRAQRRVRKAVADFLWERPIYREAAMGLAMSAEEEEHLRLFAPGLPTRWLPIGIDPPEAVNPVIQAELLQHAPGLSLPGRRRLLYMAPLNKRKGYDLLIKAFASLQQPETQLILASVEDVGTHKDVKEFFDRAGLNAAQVVYLPRMTAAQRDVLFSLSWGFVAPSRSENFGIVVTEALAAGVPVLTTTGTPWPRLDPSGTVVCVEPTAAAIASGMHRLLEESSADHAARIERGRVMVAERFSWPRIIDQLSDLYREVTERYPRRGS